MLEEEIIQSLQNSEKVIGDDAAVISFTDKNNYVVSKDLLVEDVHFRTSYFTPPDLAHKALHVNLSDIAAMGAKPLYILCGISIPNNMHEYAKNLLSELQFLCKKLGVALIGGDTTSSTEKLFISITAIGMIKKSQIKYRSTCTNNDIICVVGDIGFANIGLSLLEQDRCSKGKYVDTFLRPNAKISEGVWLAEQPEVNGMLDISDGLYIDLKRMCKLSNKGAMINLNDLKKHLDPSISIQNALEGGEDYGLLFTISKNTFASLSEKFHQKFGYSIKTIGHITDGKDIFFIKDNKRVNLSIAPFTHFGEQ